MVGANGGTSSVTYNSVSLSSIASVAATMFYDDNAPAGSYTLAVTCSSEMYVYVLSIGNGQMDASTVQTTSAATNSASLNVTSGQGEVAFAVLGGNATYESETVTMSDTTLASGKAYSELVYGLVYGMNYESSDATTKTLSFTKSRGYGFTFTAVNVKETNPSFFMFL